MGSAGLRTDETVADSYAQEPVAKQGLTLYDYWAGRPMGNQAVQR